MNKLRKLNKNKLTLEEIQKLYKIQEYRGLYSIIIELIEKETISPIKSSGLNGKSPALYNTYRVLKEKEDYSLYEEELKFKINPRLEIGYYLKNMKKYKEHRENILKLSDYMTNKSHLLENRISLNERSFEIWGQEKFLKGGGGKTLLNNLKLNEDYLNYYDTTEPLPYYSQTKKTPQNILIIENKDTFYSMRKHLLNGNETILGVEISTLIYGGGKNIVRTFKDFEYCVEPYLAHNENSIYYFGDLDYEGILIFEMLQKSFQEGFDICPFVKAYEKMIDKYISENIGLPITKEGQNRNISQIFMEYFSLDYKEKILSILEEDKYIPQEILNIGDFGCI